MSARQNNRRHGARFDAAKWARSMTLDMPTTHKHKVVFYFDFFWYIFGLRLARV